MNRVERVILALQLAGPLCLKLRYEHFPSCCVEASQAGAEALRRRGLNAKAIEVVLGVWSEDRVAWCGATEREAYDNMSSICEGDIPPFDEWVKTFPFPCPDGRHMIIEIVERERWILDLTFGQIGLMPGMTEVPAALRLICQSDGFPIGGEGRKLNPVYFKPSRPPEEGASAYRNEGLTQDMLEVMRLAQSCDLDRDRFARAVMTHVRAAK